MPKATRSVSCGCGSRLVRRLRGADRAREGLPRAQRLPRAASVARLRPAPLQDLPFDGVRLQAPDGFADASPLRLQVDSGDSLPGLRLRIDRIATPLTPASLAGLVASGALDGLEPAGAAAEGARGSLRFPGPLRMEYAIVELGRRSSSHARSAIPMPSPSTSRSRAAPSIR